MSAQIRPDATKSDPEKGAKKSAEAGSEQGSRSSSFPGLREAGDSPAEARARRAAAALKQESKALRLVRLDADIALREVPAADSPVIGDVQKAGRYYLQLGNAEFGHIPVGSLTGFVGYVHRSFFREIDEGWGETTGTNVSFRVRPRSGEPPLWAMPERGTKLEIEGRDGEWYRVLSAPSVRAWLPAASVEAAGELPAGSLKLDDGRSVAAAIAKRPEVLKQIRAQLDARAAKLAAKRKAAADAAMRKAASDQIVAQVETLRRDYQAVLGKVDASSLPRIDELAARAKQLSAALASSAKSEALPAGLVQQVQAIEAELGRRRILAVAKKQLADTEAIAKKKAADEKAREKAAAAKEAAMTLRANRRTWKRVGWIEFRPGATDYRPFRLMKGGRTIAYLECSSGRYDLSDFTGREVGLIGELSRPGAADLRVLDVERLVILSSTR